MNPCALRAGRVLRVPCKGARSSKVGLRKAVRCAVTENRTPQQSDNLNMKVISAVLACSGAALADPLMSLVDTAFVGRLGVLQLAALGPNAALFNVVFFLGFSALGVVATNQISAAHGADDRHAAGRSLVLSSVVSLALGLVITAGLVIAPCTALQLFQTNAEMMPYAKTYCVIRALGVSSALLMVVFQAAFRAVEDMRTPVLVVAASGLVNAILDPILIYTFGMGIAGAAWATSASQIAGAAMFVWLISRRQELFGLPQAWDAARQMACSRIWGSTIHAVPVPLTVPSGHDPTPHHDPAAHASNIYTAHAAAAPTPRSVSPVAAAATPSGAAVVAAVPPQMHEPSLWDVVRALCNQLPWREFCSTSLKLAVRCLLVLSTWTIASIVATKVGTYTMAAYQIMQQVLQLQLSVCWAFLAVGQSLVGVAIARSATQCPAKVPTDSPDTPTNTASHGQDTDTLHVGWSDSQKQARVVGDRIVWLAVASSMAMAVLTWVLRHAVPRLFTTDTGVLALVDGSALLMCGMLAISWNNAVEGVLMGAGDTQFVIDIYPVCVGGFVLALAGSFLAGWGLMGIWAALVFYYVGLVSTLSARFWMQRFRKKI